MPRRYSSSSDMDATVARVAPAVLALLGDGVPRSRRAIVASLVATAKLNGVEPFAYLKDVLERIVSGRTKSNRLDTLLPWAWKAARPVDT